MLGINQWDMLSVFNGLPGVYYLTICGIVGSVVSYMHY